MTYENGIPSNTNESAFARSTISRRQLLQKAGLLSFAVVAAPSLASFALPAAASASTLSLTPEQEEGPFYVGIEKIRKNITLGRPGIPLHLQIRIEDTSGKAMQNAACDIWQCDATGVYSDESSANTVGQTWLRGVQYTNANGYADFTTIYPGHYAGRTTHIHVKVHEGGKTSGATYAGGHVSHTGQLLFDDAISTEVFKLAPYTTDTATRVLNTADHVYTQQGGSKSMLTLKQLSKTVAGGFLGKATLVIDPSATPAAVGF